MMRILGGKLDGSIRWFELEFRDVVLTTLCAERSTSRSHCRKAKNDWTKWSRNAHVYICTLTVAQVLTDESRDKNFVAICSLSSVPHHSID